MRENALVLPEPGPSGYAAPEVHTGYRMKEFKFSCPQCNQRIAAEAAWVGRTIQCPACKASIVIPNPPKEGETAPAPAQPESKPAERKPAAAPPKPKAPAAKKAVETPEPPKPEAAPETAVPAVLETDLDRTRVAALTPQIKQGIVQAVRQTIRNEANWISGVNDTGEYVYAAREGGGKVETVNPTDSEATRFSLVGAVLREIHRLNVAPNAQGRRRLLDHEIPDALRSARFGDDETPEQRKKHTPKELFAASHAECLGALDLLEDEFSGSGGEAVTAADTEKLGNIRLADLVRRLEKKLPVTADDVATAFVIETQGLITRVEKLERALARKGAHEKPAEEKKP